ncbi:MAG TPA: hypothetical protein VK988_02615 [Acidimicrobiales bacterium]|nr:hypothetical protein [Acidimicrobiales bacterium]
MADPTKPRKPRKIKCAHCGVVYHVGCLLESADAFSGLVSA